MADPNATAIATALLYLECRCLDARDWQQWLEVYDPDVVYWVPAWRDEHTQTSDPDTEISQIYHDSRRGLQERVMRAQSGKSVTAMPLPRTTHFVTNIEAEFESASEISVRANWLVQVYNPRTETQHSNFGDYDLRLRQDARRWVIRWKKIKIQNDLVPALIDFYTL
ncbi:aromatic-ring-hydroxylating dioxygenase subunit beta [Immundisolibacter sp.]|uniref:aromatic-ring-hydroxylating dioxygenase subunit beta n=1 Tax=Immundisolibacter sp. TaxID=1934948 RepID=UPI0035616516